EEAVNPVADGALDDEVAARLVRPEEEAEVERGVAELHELHGRFWLFEDELDALGRAQKGLGDVLGVGVIGDADRDIYADAPLTVVRPVEEVLVDDLRVWNDGSDVVVGHND